MVTYHVDGMVIWWTMVVEAFQLPFISRQLA